MPWEAPGREPRVAIESAMISVHLRALVLLLGLVAFASAQTPPSNTPSLNLQAPEPRPLIIKGPIQRSEDGLPLGNGWLGVLVWGEGSTLRLSLDRPDLWDQRQPETLGRSDWTYATMRRLKEEGKHQEHVKLFDQPYDTIAYPTKLPGGRVEVDLGDDVEIVGFVLDFRTGRATVQLRGASADTSVHVEVHAKEPLVRVLGTRTAKSIRLLRPQGLDLLGYGPGREGLVDDTQFLEQQTVTGQKHALAVTQKSSTADEGTQPILVSIVAALLGDAKHKNPALAASSLVRAHADAYRTPGGFAASWPYYAPKNRPFVELPDARIQAQYDLCAYLYRAASAPKAPPMPLQGIWTIDNGGLPPWKGGYHNDLNTQMTYAPYLTANLISEGRSWVDFNSRLLPRYERFGREFFGMPEGCAAIPGVMALNGDPLGGWGQYSLSPTNGAWIAWQFYQHWLYTRDATFLKEQALPFVTKIAEGLAYLLTPDKDSDGALRLPLSTSPEIHDNSFRAWLAPNSNYDQSMLMALFRAAEELARAAKDITAADRWSALGAKLEALDTKDGCLTFARGEPFATSHRRLSHAMAIHPLGLLSIHGSEDESSLINRTLDQIEAKGTRAWTGYTFSWFSAMCARAGRSDRALHYLETYLNFLGPNGFHLNGDQSGKGFSGFTYRPFTLEGNFLAMEAVNEMLLQSFDGCVRIFPSVSPRWSDVRFANLRAQGNLLVSAIRRHGLTHSLEVQSSSPTTLHLLHPFPDLIHTPDRFALSPQPLAPSAPLWNIPLPPDLPFSASRL